MEIARRDWERRGLQSPQDKASPQEVVVADSAMVRAAVATESSGAHLAQDQCIVLRNLESSWRTEAESMQFGELVESYVGLKYNEQVLHNKVLANNHIIRAERARKQKRQHALVQARGVAVGFFDDVNFRAGVRAVSLVGRYSPAMLKQSGYVSAKLAVKLCAGSDSLGALKSKHLVIDATHRAAAMVRMRSEENHKSFDEAMVHVPQQAASATAFEIVLHKADATNQHTIGRQEVLLGTI